MTYTEDQLKRALARALPEKLWSHEYFDHSTQPCRIGTFFKWRSADGTRLVDLVTPHEWASIVGMVEDGLTDDQSLEYRKELQDKFPFSLHSPTVAICAKWKTRAAALAVIGAITVEEKE